MANPQQYSNPAGDLMSEINVKLRDMEEKQNLIKDRVLLIGDNLISEKDEMDLQILQIKSDMAKLNDELKRLRMAIERIVDETNGFVRKNEFEILQHQFEMFQPMEIARMSDVENMIRQALKVKK